MGNKPTRSLKILKMLRSNHPVIFIMGSTGTGKSKLAIELAKKFNGEILSADSMQVYKGLDIITNKVTPAEMEEVPHHLIDYVDPMDTYTVTNFFFDGLPIIFKLIEENKLPIIVGGTHYYLEALLWDVLVPFPDKDTYTTDTEDSNFSTKSKSEYSSLTIADLLKEKITPNSFSDIPDEVLHKCLQEIDPVSAKSLHPHNRRKVIRSLQVYQQHGRPLSKILEEQRTQSGGSTLGGPLRFPNAILLWVQTDMEVLMKRLDDRVDDMLGRGLMDELMTFHKNYNMDRVNSKGPKYTEGIFQSIGFKEFHKFLTLKEKDESLELFQQSIESMKAATRKYAKKQIKWINNRFLRIFVDTGTDIHFEGWKRCGICETAVKGPDRNVPPLYGLSSTYLDQWDEAVYRPAVEIVESKLKGVKPTFSPLPLLTSLQDNPYESHYCTECELLLVGSNTIKEHNKSKKHWKRIARSKKLAELSGILQSLCLQKQS